MIPTYRKEGVRLQAFEPEAETVALSIEDLRTAVWLVEEDEKYWVEHGQLDV